VFQRNLLPHLWHWSDGKRVSDDLYRNETLSQIRDYDMPQLFLCCSDHSQFITVRFIPNQSQFMKVYFIPITLRLIHLFHSKGGKQGPSKHGMIPSRLFSEWDGDLKVWFQNFAGEAGKWKISVRTASNPAEFWIGYPLNASQEHYHYSDLLGNAQ
jgi:hypothetical protein